MSKLRFRKKHWLIAGSIGAVVAFVISGIGAYFAYGVAQDSKANYEAKLQEADNLIKAEKAAKQMGWILQKDITAGGVIKEEDIKSEYIPDYISPGNLLSDKKELIGKTIKINALKNTVLTKEMIYANGTLDPTLRKMEIDFVRLPYRIAKDDTVDIKIVFPNGRLFVVNSKIKLRDVDFDSQMMFFEANKEQDYLLTAALVDSYVNNAELYAVQYVEPEMQPATEVNYIPNKDVLDILKADPSIADRAKYAVADILRKDLDESLKNDGIRQFRVGAELPAESGVVKRRKTLGPGAQLVTPNGTGAQAPANTTNQAPTKEPVNGNNAGNNGQGLLGGK